MTLRFWLALVSALLTSALLPSVATAGSYEVKDRRTLSGPSPFAAGCSGARMDPTGIITGAEVEPAITVNPANPRNIVGTWQQDVGLGARSDLVASSLDGGKTWTLSTIPGLTVCTGGTADFGSDPWLSAGIDGTVYFSGTAGVFTSDPPPVSVVVSRSGDGGRTWQAPTTVAPLEPGNDTNAITASLTSAGHAYLVWANWDHTYQMPMTTNFLRFSRTTDSGASWSPAVTIDKPGPTAIDFSAHILALPDGTLLAVFAQADLAQMPTRGTLLAARSVDEGRTWQKPVEVASQPVGRFTDPELGVELPQPGFFNAVVAPDGTVYAALEASTSPGTGAIRVVRSRDGGRTWTTSTLPCVSAFAFEPAIAVDSHGTVGVSWYDLRNDRPGDAMVSVDAWFAHSNDGGTSWQQTHLAGPFDLRSAARGGWIGEYQGFTALRGRGFGAIFTVAAPLAGDGPSDILWVRVGPD